jgi:DNA-binding SARP family transcriptional activator
VAVRDGSVPEIRVLGPVEVLLGGSIADAGSPKQRTVLALLAAAAPRLVSVDRLVEEVWEGSPPPRPLGSLQAYVSNLRRILEPDRRPGSPATVLVTAPPGYALRVGDDLDRIRFEHAVERGRDLLAGGDARAARDAFAAALALWRSERPYADVPVAALEPDAARLVEQRLTATEELWAAEIRLARHDAALPELRRLVAAHPLRERLWELLAVALYRAGRQADALGVLTDVRRRLAEELGIDPGPALRDLERDVLRQAPHLDPRPAAAAAAPVADVVGSEERRDILVGRDDAVAALRAAAAGAAEGRGALLVVAGEPGIGKSRLLRELPAVAPGLRIAAVTAVPEPQQAWRGWLAALAALGAPSPDVEGLEPDRARWRMAQAVRDALPPAGGAPVAIVLDDLQWLDDASAQVLAAVADDLAARPVCLVAAVRDTPAARGGEPVTAALAALTRAGAARIELRRLAAGDVAAYARAAGHELDDEQVAALHERTGGNPLFVRETMRLLTAPGGVAPVPAGEVPAGVRDLVRLRVAALPDDARTVLSVAAVLAPDVDLALLSGVCGLDPERTLDLLDVAVVHRILDEDPGTGRVRFGHALVRDAIRADLPAARRAALHLRAAEALEAGGGAGRAAALAYHLQQAAARRPDVAGRAVEAAERAAAEASGRGAPSEAATWRRRALELAGADPALPPRRHYELLVALAVVLHQASDAPAAREATLQAVTIAEGLGDERLVAEALVAYGTATATLWPGPWPDPVVLDRLRRSTARLERFDEALRCRLLSCEGAETARTGDAAATLDACDRAVAAARAAGDPALLAQTLAAHIVNTWSPGTVDARVAAALELASLPAGPVAEATGRWYAGVSMLEQGRRRDGAAHVERSRALAAGLGLPGLLAQQAWYAATELLLDGDLAASEAALHSAAAVHRRTGMWGAEETLASQLFALRDEQGRLPELIGALTAVAQAGMPGINEGVALALLRAGDAAGARAAIERALAEPLPGWGLVHSWAVRAEVIAAVGTPPQVAAATAALAPHVGRVAVAGTGVVCRGAVDRTLGLLAERAGDLPAAEAHLRSAIRIDDAGGLPGWAAYARAALARVLRATGGDPAARRVLLDEAGRVADRGLPRLAAVIAAERADG